MQYEKAHIVYKMMHSLSHFDIFKKVIFSNGVWEMIAPGKLNKKPTLTKKQEKMEQPTSKYLKTTLKVENKSVLRDI
jgi:hypothetical protein